MRHPPRPTELRRGLDDAPPEGTARLPEQARLPRARRRTGFAVSGAGSLLAACSSSTTVAQETSTTGELLGPGGLPLARPDKRVTLPLWEDPIESGLEPETGGTFTVFNYPDYLYKKLLKEFGEKYGVDVQYTAFDNITSGIKRLASGAVQPDVMEMTPDNLDHRRSPAS